MTTYTVRVLGCDASTEVQIDLAGAGATAVAKVARAITEAATGRCGPAMFIATGTHEGITETPEDL